MTLLHSDTLLHPDARLIDAATGAELSGVPLREAVHAAVAGFAELTPGVVFLRTPTTIDAIVRYIGAFEAGRPLALLDPGLPPEILADFVERFEPAAVCGPLPQDAPKGYTRRSDELWERDAPSSTTAHPDLATLLATSGSTGSPKLVRLSRSAILANTTSIIEALGITGADVAVSSLPFYYSFGMSVLNTHLAAGATVVVESEGLVARSFWPAITKHAVTSLALVPSQYEMLRRLRFDPKRYPSLRTLTQAGGRLRTELVQDFHDRMASVDGQLFVMYGQTEAAPRLTTLPAGRLAEKLGSVGPAVPGGTLTIRLEDGTETTAPGVVGEVLYRGPNVMMGYAETASDLARGDEQGGLLETGDLGHLDEDGYLFIDGRLKRFGKVFGVRLNLDDIEQLVAAMFVNSATGGSATGGSATGGSAEGGSAEGGSTESGSTGAVAAVAGDDKIIVFVEGATTEALAPSVTELADRLKLHWTGFEMRGVPALPLLSNGKVDYRALESAR